jgi:hypothetical protein
MDTYPGLTSREYSGMHSRPAVLRALTTYRPISSLIIRAKEIEHPRLVIGSYFWSLAVGSFCAQWLSSIHPATLNIPVTSSASSFCSLKLSSDAPCTATQKETPLYFLRASIRVILASGFMSLGAASFANSSIAFAAPSLATAASRLASSADFFNCAFEVSNAAICDCCSLLIPSSNTNRNIVQTDSMAIPITMNQKATRWTAAEYRGRSNMIPAPTAILASTLSDNRATWGQSGSKSPEINLLTYVSIAAMLGWLTASGLASIELGKALFALWRERHPAER